MRSNVMSRNVCMYACMAVLLCLDFVYCVNVLLTHDAAELSKTKLFNAADRVARAGVLEQDATSTPTAALAEAAAAVEAFFLARRSGMEIGLAMPALLFGLRHQHMPQVALL